MSKYAEERTLEITCPSGAVVKSRCLKQLDIIQLGQPITFDTSEEEDEAEAKTLTVLEQKRVLGISSLILLDCCSSFSYKGESLLIVDKAWDEVSDGEIAMSQISEEDSSHIIAEVMQKSGLGKEVAKKFATFPEGSTSDDQPSHDGGELRGDPSRTSEAVNS